jgi:hypothetical protein
VCEILSPTFDVFGREFLLFVISMKKKCRLNFLTRYILKL